jgi:hypothetical protein
MDLDHGSGNILIEDGKFQNLGKPKKGMRNPPYVTLGGTGVDHDVR